MKPQMNPTTVGARKRRKTRLKGKWKHMKGPTKINPMQPCENKWKKLDFPWGLCMAEAAPEEAADS
nr:MAG TPA: hypothetical protein [Microviridae sp.]